jgi:hypothetical protein
MYLKGRLGIGSGIEMPVEIGTGIGGRYSRLERGRRWELVLTAIEIKSV